MGEKENAIVAYSRGITKKYNYLLNGKPEIPLAQGFLGGSATRTLTRYTAYLRVSCLPLETVP